MIKKPKYELIENMLIDDINNKKLLPGQSLPSETELIEKFNVSRITVRRAMDNLYRKGYIEKKQGKRGYVRENTKIQELSKIYSYTEEILRQNMTPTRKVIKSCLRLCNEKEMANLELDKTSAVFYLERLINADDKPLCFTKTVLPYYLFEDIEKIDFSLDSLYDTIENKYNIKITTSMLKIKAVLPPKEISAFLDIEKDIPLILSSSVTYGIYNGKEVPIEMFETYYLTDRFEYSLVQFR